MTDDKSVDAAKAGKLAQQIVSVLANEDTVTRQRAVGAAMMLLGESLVKLPSNHTDTSSNTEDDEAGGLAAFFDREGETKPADYAYLCAAFHFSEFGPTAFSTTEIKSIAAEAGVVVPDRLDMTFGGAAKSGKKLFQNLGKGLFKPTATGGVEFKERWGVKPGRKQKALSGAKNERVGDVGSR